MASVMTATFRQRFPPEVLAEIFPHCDPATLATVSRVSSSCLALSSALLYQDITLDDELSLALLLRVPVRINITLSATHNRTSHAS
jgi:hypothetical protein